MRRYGLRRPMSSILSHATTVVTNAILQERGARAALITTRGFRDVLELRRSARANLYDLFQDAPATLIPRRLRFEITERIGADGAVVTPLAEEEIDGADRGAQGCASRSGRGRTPVQFSATRCTSKRFGERLRAALPHVPIYLSSDVLPEIKEFERSSTTAVCAYVGPILASYLARLEQATHSCGATVASSDGIERRHPGSRARPSPCRLLPWNRDRQRGSLLPPCWRAKAGASIFSPSTWAAPPPRRA